MVAEKGSQGNDRRRLEINSKFFNWRMRFLDRGNWRRYIREAKAPFGCDPRRRCAVQVGGPQQREIVDVEF